MLIDTHCHLNFRAFKEDANMVIENSLKQNVWMILVGSQSSTSERAVKMAGSCKEGVYAAVGLHPSHLEENYIDEDELDPRIKFKTRAEEFNEDFYYNLAQNEKVVAIGETGLDFFHIKGESKEIKKKQKDIFLQHIDLASKVKKPLIIHCRDAYPETLDILKSQTSNLKSGAGVMHFFAGDKDIAKKCLDLGLYISFAGVITFGANYDEVIKYIPLDRTLIETDAPYVAPVPFRGKRNEPLYVRYVAEKIAQLKNLGFEEVAEITTQNAKKVFDLP